MEHLPHVMLGNNPILSGRYRGELLDDSSRHSLAIRPPGDSPDHVVVDYFYHNQSYWTASVPLDGVAEILGQAFNFSPMKVRQGLEGPEVVYDQWGVPKRRIPGLNHLQTRFRMKPDQPLQLYPLHSDPVGEPTETIDDFIYTIEAVGPLGVGFGIWDGLNGSLVSAHRFVSTREIVFERIVVEGQYVLESPPLPLTPEQKRNLLMASIERSDRAGMREAYYLYRCCGTNNCTSNPFQLLDRTVAYSWRQRLGAFLFRLPLRPRFYLYVRGMDSDPTYRKLLRSEFADFIDDPETQKRKRVYVKGQISKLRAARKAR